MKFEKLSIADVVYVVPEVFSDERGYFFEAFHAEKFKAGGIDVSFVQDNQSKSSRGTLRGLHFQREPFAQGKLVRVLAGEIFDVAMDIRKDSATYGKWVGKRLSSERKDMLWVPPGFAHGFYVVSEFAEILYKCTGFYNKEAEGVIRWDDPGIGIDWPLLEGVEVLLSEKDGMGGGLRDV